MDDAQKPEQPGSDATLASLKQGVAHLEPVTSSTQGREEEGRAAILEAQASSLKSLHSLRKKWSPFLMGLLAVTTFFQGLFIVAVGAGWLPFKNHEIFVNTVASELFFQIAGMGYIVVRCLFPSDEARGTRNKPTEKSGRPKKGKGE